jgi:hypothetical protein
MMKTEGAGVARGSEGALACYKELSREGQKAVLQLSPSLLQES